MPPKFRLACRQIHLTFRDHLPLADLLTHLKAVVGEMVWFSLVWENGSTSPETPYAHTHCAFRSVKKMDITCERRLDFRGVHPNIKKIRDDAHARAVWEYHLKDPVETLRSDTGPGACKDIFDAVIQAEDHVEACRVFQSMTGNCPIRSVSDLIALRLPKVKKQKIHKVANAGAWIWALPSDWKVVFLHGPTGIGKTSFALDQCDSALLVRHMERLKSFSPDEHDGIVFDDMSWRQFSAQEMIHLLDWDQESTLNVKHGSITIPARTRKIFTSNVTLEEAFPLCASEHMQAIRRRIKVYVLPNMPLWAASGDVDPLFSEFEEFQVPCQPVSDVTCVATSTPCATVDECDLLFDAEALAEWMVKDKTD